MAGAASTAPEAPEVEGLLALVDRVCDACAEHAEKEEALRRLSLALAPDRLAQGARRAFVRRALERGIVAETMALIDRGGAEIASVAINFLGDFTFVSDPGTQAVLEVFDRIVARCQHIFRALAPEHLPLLDAAVLLCVNVSAGCPSTHPRLVPLVQPVCLQIIQRADMPDKLRGNTILLLANLSMTVSAELRDLRIADALLELVLNRAVSERGACVAESVIIYLHGDRKCDEVDALVSRGVVAEYCVPIMEHALAGTEFRGMYPYLLYSARLFQVLAQSRAYAEVLVAHERVVPLLVQANRSAGQPLRVASDSDGRRLALEALRSLARFRLWPAEGSSPGLDWPELLAHEHAGLRASAAKLWACLHTDVVTLQLLVGRRLEAEGRLPAGLWRLRVLACLHPCLAECP